MYMYVLGLVSLGNHPKLTLQQLKQKWFVDDGTSWGYWGLIIQWYDILDTHIPPRGYYPKPVKSVVAVHPNYITEADETFKEVDRKVVSDNQYLDMYISDLPGEIRYIKHKTEERGESVKKLAEVAKHIPQTAYSGMQRLPQQER